MRSLYPLGRSAGIAVAGGSLRRFERAAIRQGRIVQAMLGEKRLPRAISAETELSGCRLDGEAAVRSLEGGGVEFTKRLVQKAGQGRCLLRERFLPGGDSVRWEIEIRGQGGPWSTDIISRLQYPGGAERLFWTAWSDPDHRHDAWRDPLTFRPFADRQWTYNGLWADADQVCIPLATVVEPAADAGLSLVLSPEDVLLDMRVDHFRRRRHCLEPLEVSHRRGQAAPLRHGPGGPCGRLAVAGWGGWCGAIPSFSTRPIHRPIRWPAAGRTRPINGTSTSPSSAAWPSASTGCAARTFPTWACSCRRWPTRTPRWRRATDEPPIPGKSEFNSFKSLNDYSRFMRENDFYALNYFNVTEFGRNMRWPSPPRRAAREEDLWKDPNDFLYARCPDALLLSGGRPIVTCYGAFVVDMGNPAYQKFMLEQARRHIEKLPDSSGICIDRLDWLRYYNPRGDDGVSWVDGKPARSLFLSWRELMSKLGPHDARGRQGDLRQ